MKPCKYQHLTLYIFIAIVAGISFFGLLGCQPQSSIAPAQLCNFQIGPCQALLKDGTNLEFSISPYPIQPLTDLEFEVVLVNESVKTESVDLTLTMPTMSMPKNRIHLMQAGNGRFIGKGSIVRCLSGDRTWNSLLELNSAQSQTRTVSFQFEVEP